MATGGWVVPAGLARVPDVILQKIREKSEQSMQVIIDQCVEDVKRFISTRPRPTSKYGGRIDTGELLKSISGRVRWDGDVLMGEIYHNDGGANYYILQIGGEVGGGDSDYNPGGFRHYPDGAWIESSFAARDAALIAIDSLMAELEKSL